MAQQTRQAQQGQSVPTVGFRAGSRAEQPGDLYGLTQLEYAQAVSGLPVLDEATFGPVQQFSSNAPNLTLIRHFPHPDAPADPSRIISLGISFGAAGVQSSGFIATNNPLFIWAIEKAIKENPGEVFTYGDFLEAKKPPELKVKEAVAIAEEANNLVLAQQERIKELEGQLAALKK